LARATIKYGNVYRGQHLPVLGLEQEPFIAVTNVLVHHLGERRVEVDVPVGCWRFERVRDATASLAALLPDEQRAPVIRDVLLDAECEKLRYAHVGPRQECGSNSVPALRICDDVSDFVCRKRGAVLLSLIPNAVASSSRLRMQISFLPFSKSEMKLRSIPTCSAM
jgi:hypothetical protein